MGILHSNDPMSEEGVQEKPVCLLCHIRLAFQTAPVCCSNTALSQKIFIMSFIAAMMTFLGLVTGIFTVTSLAQKVTGSLSEQGTVVPAETRPCVDCHAFEFMERALQDFDTAAHNLDTQAEKLLLRIEERDLCYCIVQSQELQNSIYITNNLNA